TDVRRVAMARPPEWNDVITSRAAWEPLWARVVRVTLPVLRPNVGVAQQVGVCVTALKDSNDGLWTRLDAPANDCVGTSAHASEASAAPTATRVRTADGMTTPFSDVETIGAFGA